jgi:hypothetical protein
MGFEPIGRCVQDKVIFGKGIFYFGGNRGRGQVDPRVDGPMDRWTYGPMDPGPGDSQPWRKGCEINHPYGWFIMVYVDGIALPTFF